VSVSDSKATRLGLELGAQLAEVLDDAVVHHRDGPARCGWALVSVGAPWVAQRVWPMPVLPRIGSRTSRSESAMSLPTGAAPVEPARRARGDAGAVVAAVFEPLQRLEDEGRHLVAAEDADDAAHLSASLARALMPPSAAPSASREAGLVDLPAAGDASAPSGTSSVTVEPAATIASAPTVTGATSMVFEPMKARAPISVRCFMTPS
jgi:hypothetical protein